MRQRLVIAFGPYLLLALGTRATGLHRCACSSACWCKKPLLSAFRWVTSVSHRQRLLTAVSLVEGSWRGAANH